MLGNEFLEEVKHVYYLSDRKCDAFLEYAAENNTIVDTLEELSGIEWETRQRKGETLYVSTLVMDHEKAQEFANTLRDLSAEVVSSGKHKGFFRVAVTEQSISAYIDPQMKKSPRP